MGLRLHNTLTRTKQEFVPIDPANVRMYVCGPTVYDFAHIGNARPLIVFDVLYRLLRHLYGAEHVTYVRNITDVDDKINARAAEEYPDLPLNEAIRKVTEKTERQFHEDAAALGCLEPTREPRATEHIDDMKAMIETLIAKGYAYVAEDNVLFHVAAMADYGKLSNRSLDDMIAGARVEVAPYKRDPMDFVLWKPSRLGEPAWPSPAGVAVPGRPGWHLECSAMSDRWLWQEALPTLSESGRARPHQFDIHGGGIDLLFPHHENEVAQTRCAHGTEVMANYWLHNGFLQVEGEKMSKSLGNFVTIRELLEEWPGEAIRLNMLKSHYRQPVDWTEGGLHDAVRTLDQWYDIVGDVGAGMLCADAVDALNDDLNTPKVFTVLHQLRDEAVSGPPGAKACLKATAEMLGLLVKTATEWRTSSRAQASVDEKRVVDLITSRAAARKAKNFAEADRIRAELDAMGIALKDSKNPETGLMETTWEVKR
jgi:cysteinyl-tRNA synthetase